MKALTKEHLKVLEHAEIEEFIDDIVKDLEELSLAWAFPNKKEEYRRFVHLAYKKSLKYGLETEKDCHAFIMAWHTLGSKMIQTKWMMDIINDDANFNWEKREALLCACYEKLDEMEGE